MPVKQALPGCLRISNVVAGGEIARSGRIGILLFLVLTGSFLRAANPVIILDGAGTGRMFEGEGAMSAGGTSRLLIDYPEPYRGQILDYLFKPNYGANLQDLKVELGGDMNSTAGAEPSHMHSSSDQDYKRGFEWWLMEQAKLRNPNITLGILAWGAPGWIGNGHFFSQDAIYYIINFIQGAKTFHNLTIDYVGILDERPYETWWIIQLKAALRAQGLTTKIVAADESRGTIIEDVQANPALMDAVDVLGFHYPRFDGGPIPVNKPIWASEDGQAWSWNGNWPGAAYLAKAYIRPYINSKITRHQVWSLVTSYYDMLMFPGSGQMYANTPWSGNYRVQPAIWATAHTNQFAGPGWQYIDNSCGFLGAGSYVTVRKGSDFSLIIENVDGADTPVTFNIVNGLSTGVLHVWKSDQTTQFVQQADINPVNGSFSLTVAAGSIYSLTTTTGQAKGDAAPPPAAPFPFPYADNFENYPLSAQAKYFFDLNGSFEITNCAGGRTGLCLRQAAPAPPIPWTTIGPIEPSNVIGSTNWDNYQVSSDVFFEQPGTVKLMGRVTGLNVNNGEMYGYELYVDHLGNWSLRQGNFVSLAGGSVPFAAGAWHTLKMVFYGGAIRIVIDGSAVADLNSGNTHTRGMAGLGVKFWTTAQFDNFRIDPIPGAGTPVPQSQITVTATGETAGYEAAKAVDGDSRTFWNSPFTCVGGCRATQPLPQSLTLALGGTYSVQSVRYASRQDNNQSGSVTSYNVYVSSDGTNFTKVASGNWTANAAEKSANFTPTSASYVRLEAVAAIGGVAAASEVNVDYDPGGGTANPVPSIGSLFPSFAAAGDGDLVLSVGGSNFIAGSVVRWNGTDRATNFVNGTVLNATIPATDLASAGTAVVTVFNPTPGGGLSSGQTFTINPPGTGGGPTQAVPFVTGFAPGQPTLRNDYSGWAGMRLTVGATPLKVSSVGRICLAGNAGDHPVKFVNADETDVPNGSAVVHMAGCAVNQFVYSTLAVPITLQAGTSYYLASLETRLGDQFYEFSPVTYTAAAAINSAAYFNGAHWISINGPGTSYVPPNFLYAAPAASTITVTVQTNPAGRTFTVDGTSYSAGQTLSWTQGSSHSIAIATPQNGAAGTRYVWNNWSDGGAMSHTVSPSTDTTFVANFGTQYLLSSTVTPQGNGSVAANPTSTNGYYDNGTSVQLTAAANAGYAFQNWTGDLSGSANPQSITMSASRSVTAALQTVGGGSGGALEFVTGFAPGTIRNDFGGWVGMKFTVGTNPLTVSALGRACLTGNSNVHSMKFVNAADGTDVAGGSISVNMAGCTAGQFTYGNPVSPLTLAAGGTYYLVSQEVQGGDRWYNFVTVATLADASVKNAVYSSSGGWAPNSGPNSSYVPLNFKYTLPAAGSVTVTMQTNPAGRTFTVDGTQYSASQVFHWNAGSPHTVSTATSQSGAAGIQYVWSSWSDAGTASHTITPSTDSSLMADFRTQYLLSSVIAPSGTGSVAANPASASGYYDAGTPVQLTATANAGLGFLNWSGDLTGNGNPQTLVMSDLRTVTANFQAPSGGSTNFVTGYALNNPIQRNDFGGWVGMKLTVGQNSLNVSSIGRICVAGNAEVHALKLVNVATGADVPGASTSVNMAGCSGGQFVFAALPGAVTLAAGTSYYLVSRESQGGDKWYNVGQISTTSDATANNSVYSTDGNNWSAMGATNTAYVPPNFQYLAAPADPNPPFVTGFSSSTPRNDFTGWVGMKLTVGANPVTVSSLARLCVIGNSGIHTAKFVLASSGADVPGGSASINLSGCVAGQFSYAALSTPLTLQAGTAYYLVSQEVSGGDRWYDFGNIKVRPVAVVNSAVYSTTASWATNGAANVSYVPVNFR